MTLLALLLAAGCDKSTDTSPPEPADDTAADDTAADDTAVDDTASGPATVAGLPLAEAGLCDPGEPSEPPAPGPLSGVSGPSPFGTGASRQPLGALVDPSVVVQAPNPGVADYTVDLEARDFDVYVPPSYDGSEPYGLLMFINAGNEGLVDRSWQAVLDEQRLIVVGGRGLGNSTDTRLRMGQTVLGAWRALELFNIDRSRVMITGTSGGARVATVTAFQHPDLFRLVLPLCGAAWYRPVTQAYETQEPDSHYEYWGDGYYPRVDGQPFGDQVAARHPRFAWMTSYDDFREGDIQNVHHHGAGEDGLPTRLLERPGGHCATDAAQLRDALAWVQSPDFAVVQDPLTDDAPATSQGAGAGLVDAGPAAGARLAGTADGLVLSAGPAGAGLALSRDRLAWTDPAGAVVSVVLDPDPAARATVGLWSWDPAATADALADAGGEGAPAALLVAVERADEGGLTLVVATRGADGARIELLRGTLADAGPGDAVRVELHAWASELQVRTDHHLGDGAVEGGGAKLLDDRRTLQLRWSTPPGPATGWSEEGAVLALSASSLSGGVVTARVRDLVARDATGWACR